MLVVPVQPVQNQTLTVTLANQPVRLNIYQKDSFAVGPTMYMDVLLNDAPVINSVICENANRIIQIGRAHV